ncbi:hypothetical protein BDR07DRAFT_1416367 [Suillus spraguei]|nr:hypothetical protein BDR07DRAFT_1416367 [Suillus spraguei]
MVAPWVYNNRGYCYVSHVEDLEVHFTAPQSLSLSGFQGAQCPLPPPPSAASDVDIAKTPADLCASQISCF